MSARATPQLPMPTRHTPPAETHVMPPQSLMVLSIEHTVSFGLQLGEHDT
jgi:hypothetical protein